MGSEEEKKNDEVVEQESPILNQLSIITDNLETYQGRDTCLTAMHWTALVIADLCKTFTNLPKNQTNLTCVDTIRGR